jgi:hypothetical protein
LQIAIYKNGQINAIWQIIKIPLYRDFLQFIKTAKIIAILQIKKIPSIENVAIYKNGQIIAIVRIIKNSPDEYRVLGPE